MMSQQELGPAVDKLYQQVAGGNRDAYAFLVSFDEYFEDVTAFILSANKNQRDFVALLARTNTVYSLPWFIRHGQFLHLPIQQAFNSLADGMAWSTHPEQWRRQWAEICSLALVEVVLSVGNLTLGFVDCRKLSPELRKMAWACRIDTHLKSE